MIGIYKITSPTKKVYIGQSINIEKRFNTYKRLDCKKQPAIYNSFLKYGINKHKFEIICECDITELNDKERYYQDAFSTIGNNGLNCKLTTAYDRSGKLSEETKAKMSVIKIGNTYSLGKKTSEETKLKIKRAIIEKWQNEEYIKKTLEGLNRRKDPLKMQKKRINYINSLKKVILNTQTGIFYYSVVEAANSINMNKHSLGGKLRGYDKVNKTPFIYV
jgi:group I intron endonuclease